MTGANNIRRYIVQTATHRFLTAAGQWTDTIENAAAFSSFTAMLRICREHRLKNVEILMQRSGGEAEVRIPLRC